MLHASSPVDNIVLPVNQNVRMPFYLGLSVTGIDVQSLKNLGHAYLESSTVQSCTVVDGIVVEIITK